MRFNGAPFYRAPNGLWYGPLASSKGSELWAPILKVVCNGVIMVLQGFRVWGPYQEITFGFMDCPLSWPLELGFRILVLRRSLGPLV